MIELQFLPKLMAVHTSATISPGPNFALVFKVATENSRLKTSVAASLGVTIGILAHASLAVFGVSQLLASHPEYMVWLKVAASFYLIYLGYLSLTGAYKLIKQSKAVDTVEVNRGDATKKEDHLVETPGELWKAFTLGLSNCILNPKAFFYFVTVLPQGLVTVLSPPQAIVTLLTLGSITFGWFYLVSLFFRMPLIQSRVREFRVGVSALTGTVFFILAGGFIVDVVKTFS